MPAQDFTGQRDSLLTERMTIVVLFLEFLLVNDFEPLQNEHHLFTGFYSHFQAFAGEEIPMGVSPPLQGLVSLPFRSGKRFG